MRRLILISLAVFMTSFAAGYFAERLSNTIGSQGAETSQPAQEILPEVREDPVRPPMEAKPRVPTIFDAGRAMETVRMLCVDIGVRVEGTENERRAAHMLQELLLAEGLDNVHLQSFYLPGGGQPFNVIAEVKGRSADDVIVVGAHYDSRHTTTGANDNASGAACVVELARVFKHNGGAYPTLRFILFGAEEDPGDETAHVNCHFGSRHYVNTLTPQEKERIVGMISLDMVGYGDTLYARYMEIGPMSLVRMFQALGLPIKKGGNLSDHEPFEKAGIPSVWLEYIPAGQDYDPHVHKMSDDFRHVNSNCIQNTGQLVQRFLESLDETSCSNLRASRN